MQQSAVQLHVEAVSTTGAAVAAVVGLQVRIPQELMAQPVAGVA